MVDRYDIIKSMAIKYTYNKDGSVKSAITKKGSTKPSERRTLSKSEIDQKISNYFKTPGISDSDKIFFRKKLLGEIL